MLKWYQVKEEDTYTWPKWLGIVWIKPGLKHIPIFKYFLPLISVVK